MGDLCSVADVELYLLQNFAGNPSVINETDRIEYLITAVSAKIAKYCDRVFEATNYVEQYDGDGTNELFLNQYPVNSVSSIYYGSPFDTRTVLDTDVYTENDNVILFNFNSVEAERFFEVTYNAGYEEIPDDLNLITVKMVVNELLNTETNSNLKSEMTGDVSHTYFSNIQIDQNSKVDLSTYKRVGF